MNPVADEQLAQFVVDSHTRSHPNSTVTQEIEIKRDVSSTYYLSADYFVVDSSRPVTQVHFVCQAKSAP